MPLWKMGRSGEGERGGNPGEQVVTARGKEKPDSSGCADWRREMAKAVPGGRKEGKDRP